MNNSKKKLVKAVNRTEQALRHPPGSARFFPVIVLVWCLLPVDFLPAQAVETLAPRLPALPETTVREGEVEGARDRVDEDYDDTVSLTSEEDVPLLPELQGVVLFADDQGVEPAGIPGVTGFEARGLEVPAQEKLRGSLQPFIGEPFSTGDLREINRAIILHYRDVGRPVVDVITPAQDLTAGVLQLVVIEGRLGKLDVRNAQYFRPEQFTDKIRTAPGELLLQDDLLADLDWINTNPFRRVDLIYTPGDEFGITDLILDVNDERPFQVFTGIENSGTESTGEELLLAGFNWGNVFGWEHIFSYQASATTDFESLISNSFIYQAPLPWRHTLTVLGLHVHTETDDHLSDLPLNTGGESRQLSLRYEVPMPQIRELRHRLNFGFDFKQTNNNLAFGGLEIFDVTTEIYQFVFGYEAELKDRWGATSINAAVTWSPGGFSSDNETEVFQQSRAFAEADYLYAEVELERLTKLPADFTLVTRLGGQLADTNLLPSEQLGLGGSTTVRGYDPFAVRGDEGIAGSVELRTPAFAVLEHLNIAKLRDSLQFLAFYDFGVARSVERLPDEPESITLQSIGLGLRYQLLSNLMARLDYGWQLEELPFAGEDDDDGRLDFSVLLSF
jgi:hemolysin activation/secretion protein